MLMKRLLSLMAICSSLLVLFAQASWAADSYTTSYLLQEGETHSAGDQVSVTGTDGSVVATLTFGFAGEADYQAAKSYNLEGYNAFTVGNGVNGKADGNSGTCYIINPTYNGVVTVGVVLNASKSFYILEDDVAMSDYNGITVDSKYYGTYSFNVKAGSTYKVTAAGTKLGFFGLYYEYTTSGDVTPVQVYQLTAKVTPESAGYTNLSSSQQLKAGATVSVRTYANSSTYKFQYWTANGEQVSTSSSFTYTMPAENVELVAVYKYSPENPADPQSEGKKYTLTLQSVPNNACSFNHNTVEKVVAGTQVYLYSYNNTGYEFDHWEADGQTLSTDRSYYYTMPEKDVTVQAVYKYNPSSPADPETPKLTYTVTLTAQPTGAGYFSWSNVTQVEAGQYCNIYAYPNSGYKFREWQKDGVTVSSSQRYNFDMPSEHVNLMAIFDYSPVNPGHPNSNYWNPETGEVIVDDFTTGDLYSTIYNLVGGYDNMGKVQSITVQGEVNSNDWSIARNFSNCGFIDMSRTRGLNYVPQWCFENATSLRHVALPQDIERIENYAFYGCSNLTIISCHAITPPALDSYAFQNAPDGVVVYVPAYAVALYQEADGWKDLVASKGYIIMPFGDEVSSLAVNLPDGTDLSLYKDMYIELINIRSGQKQRYVITNRTTYTFSSLIHNTTYNVYLKNAAGKVLGEIDNVKIENADVEVTFTDLLVPRTLTLSVKTPGGDDVTEQTTITWLDEKDAYLNKGNRLAGLLDGTKVKYRIQLPQALAMQYEQPAVVDYEVQPTNDIIFTLTAIPQLTLTGKVTDLKTTLPMAGATVSVSQMINGQYSKAYTTKTNAQGEWSQDILLAPTDVTASQTDYVSQSVSLTTEELQQSTAVPTFELKDINGTTINMTLTYTPVEGDTQSYFSDYANVNYSVYDETAKQQVTEMNVQYPQIVLMESLPEGTELTITATSKNGKFMPVSGKATVDSKDVAEVTLPIVQLGGIKATFGQTTNNSIVGILYNGNNRLIKRFDYNGASLTISELTDGEYTLVTMAPSQFFNSVANLDQFAESGLREGVDYVKNKVTVKSGAFANIYNAMIPYLDETKLYYTGNNTSVAVNRSQITVGNYLTINSRVDFKSAYASQVEDVKLVFNLPQESSFVPNSVMAGSSTSAYTTNEQQIIVPLENLSDRVRFCFIPTMGGENAVTASVQFTINGKEITQPIGEANYTAKDLSIIVPSIVAKPLVPISGTAVGKSAVSIYDNGTLVGQTTSLANGSWTATIDLGNPYNLSTHQIYAKLTSQLGVEMQSETKSVTYDANAIQLQKVTMFYSNPEEGGWQGKNYELVFDFQNPSTTPHRYTYYIYNRTFTFTVDFTNNDPEKVRNVVLYVKTGDGKWNALNTVFDQNKGKWIATGEFGNMYDGIVPVNVSVDYEADTPSYLDRAQLDEPLDMHVSIQKEMMDDVTEVNQVFSTQDQDQIDAYMNEQGMGGDFGLQYIEDPVALESQIAAMSDDEKAAYLAQFFGETSALISDIAQETNNLSQSFAYDESWSQIDMGNCIVKRTTVASVDPETLIADGYEAFSCNDGTVLYIKSSELECVMIDAGKSVQYTFIYPSSSANALRRAADGSFTSETLREWTKRINDTLDGVKDLFSNLNKTLDDILVPLVKKQADLGRRKGVLTILKRNCNPAMLHIYNQEIQSIDEQLALLRIGINGVKKVTQAVGKYMPVAKYSLVASDAVLDLGKLYALYVTIPNPCENDQAKADDYMIDVFQKAGFTFSYYMGYLAFDVSTTVSSVTQAAAGLASGGSTVVTAIITTLAKMGAEALAGYIKDKLLARYISDMEGKIRKLECYPKCNGRPCGDNGDHSGGGTHHSGYPDCDVPIDPSGYVYEAVPSNRLQGVTATAYYKEIVEDMYGDKHENIVLWNAEEYAQENPLFTDENGMYRWDVPTGTWQVKFEKDGYQTAYSDWLPVPPPQLDVNIPMTQLLQPQVKKIQASSEGVEIEFDKYMDPETLTTENIIVKKNGGTAVDGNIELLNDEAVKDGEAQTYASRIFFRVPNESPLTPTDQPTLTVKKVVKSYAGIPMEEDYTTESQLDVEQLVTSVVVDDLINIAYGGTQTITVAALPVDAAKGKKMDVTSLSNMIATTNLTEVTLDENGQAEVVVTGELPGSTSLSFTVQDTDVKGQMTVNVKDEALLVTAAPRASRVSGTQVYRGTKIMLTSETENATIYYTLDGSCPCDYKTNPNVFVYNPEEPIVIADDNITIKAMAIGQALAESDVKEFTYSLKKTALNYQVPNGWLWMSHNLESSVAVNDFVAGTSIERIISQTGETVKDPSWGFFGNITELQPASGYKVRASAAGEKPLNGNEFNAQENAVPVVSGWNWIGYPLNQVMTVDEALTYFAATTGDYIVGQDGFAEFDGTKWQGTLEGLKPGQGYLFKSATNAAISFNTNIVSNAVSSVGKRNWLINSPWAFDRYAYKDVMPVTAELFADGSRVGDNDYVVAAFVGTECRGVGQWKAGRLLISVYGDSDDAISFVAFEPNSEKYYNLTENLRFTADNQGSWFAPIALTLGSEATGMKSLYDGLKIEMARDYIKVTAGGRYIDRLAITNLKGMTVLSVNNLGNGGMVATGSLLDGVYIITVEAEGNTLYKKILKANK